MVSDSTLHALLGAVVATVLFFVPFSPALGGGVAAYLSEADPGEGIRIGALAGLITEIPLFLLGLVGVSLLGFAVLGLHAGAAVGVGGVLVLLVVGLFTLAYTVGLSALGGYVGSYLVERRSREAA
jgi:hypothetical protein